ncbi:MAG: iron transporter [Anaerolineales bacterium]|nr:iron transporter [Anaerolineales bacterium]
MNQTKPPMQASDEATKDELDLAREQGRELNKALNHMVSQVADDGQEKQVGDYLVSYAVEGAEGMYHLENGELVWRAPEKENIHVEVGVRDAADGRFVPNLVIHARLIDSQNNDVGYHRQPYVWHPWLYHYGRNWYVPEAGDYRLEIHIQAPDFPRHDKKNGRRYAKDVDVEFSPVKIEL